MGKLRIPLCIGHRGAAAAFPENTLVSFRAALAAGADGVELDTHVTRDGLAVVFHDDTLARLTGARGRVRRQTFRQLQELRVRGEPIPTLAAALALVCPRGLVQVEIKRGVPVGPVVRAIQRAKAAPGVVLASFSPDAIREAAALAPNIPRMLIAERPRFRSARASALNLLGKMAAVGASGISVDHRAIAKGEFVDTVHAHGAALWCWTVNDPARMRQLAGWGIDAIISDEPRMLRKVLTTDARG